MFTKKVLVSMLLAAGMFGAAATPLTSVAAVYVTVAPPPDRVEVVPAARRGYSWAPGYWDYRSNRHRWVKGTWVRDRSGYNYEQRRWVERDGRWTLQGARWNRGDRDRDGVPNSRDRDRDGDGVRNSRDAAPNNPNRR